MSPEFFHQSIEYFVFSALIFDPYTLQVYNSESGSSDTSPKYPYAVACPAADKNEKALNDGQSFDHKALFIRSFHKTVSGGRIENCATSIELAAVNLGEGHYKDIDFGYEVFVYLNMY